MGVKIPLGFGQWTLPIRLAGDLEEMVITCGFVDGDPTDLPNDVANSITNDLLARPTFAASSISTNYTLGPGRVVVHRVLGTFEGVGSVTRVGTGSIATPPHNCAILVRKNSARGGRRGKGRMYLPPIGLSEGNVTAVGVITQSIVDSISLDFETWRANLSALNLQAVLLHSDKVDPDTGEIIELAPPPDPVLSFVCQQVIATQRTRMRR